MTASRFAHCSGKFEKGMTVKQAATGKDIKLAQPQASMADAREGVEEAWAGDIIGLFDPHLFAGRYALYRQKSGVCRHPPYLRRAFARVSTLDSLKRKQFLKRRDQLATEGRGADLPPCGRHRRRGDRRRGRRASV